MSMQIGTQQALQRLDQQVDRQLNGVTFTDLKQLDSNQDGVLEQLEAEAQGIAAADFEEVQMRFDAGQQAGFDPNQLAFASGVVIHDAKGSRTSYTAAEIPAAAEPARRSASPATASRPASHSRLIEGAFERGRAFPGRIDHLSTSLMSGAEAGERHGAFTVHRDQRGIPAFVVKAGEVRILDQADQEALNTALGEVENPLTRPVQRVDAEGRDYFQISENLRFIPAGKVGLGGVELAAEWDDGRFKLEIKPSDALSVKAEDGQVKAKLEILDGISVEGSTAGTVTTSVGPFQVEYDGSSLTPGINPKFELANLEIDSENGTFTFDIGVSIGDKSASVGKLEYSLSQQEAQQMVLDWAESALGLVFPEDVNPMTAIRTIEETLQQR